MTTQIRNSSTKPTSARLSDCWLFAILNGPTIVKKRLLMTRLSELIEADVWSWIVSRAAATNDNPAVGGFLYGGLTDQEFAAVCE